jgi:hypothetical protein
MGASYELGAIIIGLAAGISILIVAAGWVSARPEADHDEVCERTR